MGFSHVYGPGDDEESKNVLRHAIKIVRTKIHCVKGFQLTSLAQGCTFWNTATIYGKDQHNEKLIGEVLREGDNRSKVIITTKWGLRPEGTDGKHAFGAACVSHCFADGRATCQAQPRSLRSASSSRNRTSEAIPTFGCCIVLTTRLILRKASRQWRKHVKQANAS